MTRIQTMVCCAFFAALSAPAQTGMLSAGAARMDITFPKDASLPVRGCAGRGRHQGIHDNL